MKTLSRDVERVPAGSRSSKERRNYCERRKKKERN